MAALLCILLFGCSVPTASSASSPPIAGTISPSPTNLEARFKYRDRACDPDDPRIATSGIDLPSRVRPEARIAAACIALEWISNSASAASLVEVVRSPRVNVGYEEPHRNGLLAMERLIGRHFVPAGAPIKALLIGDAMEWGCEYGRREIDPLIPLPNPWTEEWLGCSSQSWPCGESNIELTNGVRLVFAACERIDAHRAPSRAQASEALRSGHELVHILQRQLSEGVAIGTLVGFDWALEGVPVYLDTAAAWLAGYSGDWRNLEDRKPYRIWRAANPTNDLSIRLISAIDLTNGNSPQMQLRWILGSLATEYLIAHWGFDAAFAFWTPPFADADKFSNAVFGVTFDELSQQIDTYLRGEIE